MYDEVMNLWEYRYKRANWTNLLIGLPGEEPYFMISGLFGKEIVHYMPDDEENRAGVLWAREVLLPNQKEV